MRFTRAKTEREAVVTAIADSNRRQGMAELVDHTRAKTEREAVVTAIADFNRRQGMAELAEHAGTCPAMMTVDELRAQRWERAVAGAPD